METGMNIIRNVFIPRSVFQKFETYLKNIKNSMPLFIKKKKGKKCLHQDVGAFLNKNLRNVSLFLILHVLRMVKYKQDSKVFSSDQYRGKRGIDAVKRKSMDTFS